jgi:hypothetical protein
MLKHRVDCTNGRRGRLTYPEPACLAPGAGSGAGKSEESGKKEAEEDEIMLDYKF